MISWVRVWGGVAMILIGVFALTWTRAGAAVAIGAGTVWIMIGRKGLR